MLSHIMSIFSVTSQQIGLTHVCADILIIGVIRTLLSVCALSDYYCYTDALYGALASYRLVRP